MEFLSYLVYLCTFEYINANNYLPPGLRTLAYVTFSLSWIRHHILEFVSEIY